ncbi:MAG: LON peptidase substrate-binding domain-containing protein [Candidatus Heimdallarchaeota archaeon]|nr:LON peptidase substrate-binding domain-containing protein [Candidatus Heimdallarchaeota archaeon]
MDIPNILPLFPLPDLVLFPGVMINLYIFEQRYKEMMAHLIQKPGHLRLFVISTSLGRRTEKYDNSAFFEIGAICHLVSFEETDDDRYNILIDVISLARLEEIPFLQVSTLYRQALIEIVTESWNDDSKTLEELQSLLKSFCEKYQVDYPAVSFDKLDEVVNSLCFVLPFFPTDKLELLKADPESRIRLLKELLEEPYQFTPLEPRENIRHN